MTRPRLLLVEDDPAIRQRVEAGLERGGFEVESVATVADGVALAGSGRFALVVLDLNLPDGDGLAVLQRLRQGPATPVVVLTARSDLGERLRCFELGATDYMAKPFWVEELLVRIRLRLAGPAAPSARRVTDGEVVVDLDARTVQVAERAVALTRTEFDLLAYLVERPGRAVPRERLAESALRLADRSDTRTVDAHISRLRHKLGEGSDCVATVWGIGYRFGRAG